MNNKSLAHVLLTAVFVLALAGSTLAQQAAPTPPAPAAAADPAYDAAQRVFDAMPEADRRAVQEALIWTGDFQSVVTGAYGKRTQAAINAYAKRSNLPQNGLLDDKARATLLALAATTKKNLAFGPVVDKASGASVGIPIKLLTKVTQAASGARYWAADNSASLETFSVPPATTDFPGLFDRMKADQPGRKVTYKLLRPDFFVVTGEMNGQTFYTRVAKGDLGLRGYTLSYAPAQKAIFDRISIAVANSFDPFQAVVAAAVPSHPAPSAPGAAPIAATPAAPVPAVAKPTLEATGLIVGPGMVLAALPANGCNDPATNRAKAKLVKQDPATGLSILEVAGLPARPMTASAASEGPAVVLFFQPSGGQALLAAAAGEVFAGAPARLRAPLTSGQTGGAVFDRSGALIGLLRPRPQLTAGPAMPSSYEIAPAAAALALAGANAATAPAGAPSRSVGEIVAGASASVVAIFCTR